MAEDQEEVGAEVCQKILDLVASYVDAEFGSFEKIPAPGAYSFQISAKTGEEIASTELRLVVIDAVHMDAHEAAKTSRRQLQNCFDPVDFTISAPVLEDQSYLITTSSNNKYLIPEWILDPPAACPLTYIYSIAAVAQPVVQDFFNREFTFRHTSDLDPVGTYTVSVTGQVGFVNPKTAIGTFQLTIEAPCEN